MATSPSASAGAGEVAATSTAGGAGTSRERRERDALATTGRRESRERRPRVKEPPSGDYLREILLRQEPTSGAAVDATGESIEVYGRPCSAGAFESSCQQSLTEVASSGDRSKCTIPSRQSSAATPMSALPSDVAASTASVPSMLASAMCSPEDAETQRRRTLFEIQRLMLEARPYDSIEFFHVQRELVKYLGLEPQRRASIADYLLAPGPPEGTVPIHPPQQSNASQSSSGSNKHNETKNEGGRGRMAASKSFWKRLRSRLRLGTSSSNVPRTSATEASTANNTPDGTNSAAAGYPPKGDGDVVQEV